MVPYINDLGLRDYRPHVETGSHGFAQVSAWSSRWPWLVLIVCVLGLALRIVGGWR